MARDQPSREITQDCIQVRLSPLLDPGEDYVVVERQILASSHGLGLPSDKLLKGFADAEGLSFADERGRTLEDPTQHVFRGTHSLMKVDVPIHVVPAYEIRFQPVETPAAVDYDRLHALPGAASCLG